MNWKYITESDEVSLHDCLVTEWVFGEDITLNFEDGFDVCRANPLNDTGRHKRTGKSAVILKGGQFVSGTLYITKTEEKRLFEADFSGLEIEILELKRTADSVILECDAWRTEHGDCFCELKFKCEGIVYCWNEFTDDAWFQDYPKGNV
ncbi:MAG: hypothetical protein K2N06_01890 [Oscillospiraceae bacterium]|nr:hypothetical protein [Oscillospiraceae bacterium]